MQVFIILAIIVTEKLIVDIFDGREEGWMDGPKVKLLYSTLL